MSLYILHIIAIMYFSNWPKMCKSTSKTYMFAMYILHHACLVRMHRINCVFIEYFSIWYWSILIWKLPAIKVLTRFSQTINAGDLAELSNFYNIWIGTFKPLWPGNATWRQRSESTLAQAMACCLTAPSHYLNKWWLITNKVQIHSFDRNFTRDTPSIDQ